MLYAHIKDGKVYREVDLDPNEIPAHKKSYLLPIVKMPRAVIDDAKQVDEGAETVIEAKRVVYRQKVRNKTKAEKDSDAAAREAALDADVDNVVNDRIGKALFIMNNQMRKLNSQDALTPGEFKTWIKGL